MPLVVKVFDPDVEGVALAAMEGAPTTDIVGFVVPLATGIEDEAEAEAEAEEEAA
jgi:hypothetical protein